MSAKVNHADSIDKQSTGQETRGFFKERVITFHSVKYTFQIHGSFLYTELF